MASSLFRMSLVLASVIALFIFSTPVKSTPPPLDGFYYEPISNTPIYGHLVLANGRYHIFEVMFDEKSISEGNWVELYTRKLQRNESVNLNEDEFQEALLEAESRIRYQKLTGRKALESILTEWYELNNSLPKVSESHQRILLEAKKHSLSNYVNELKLIGSKLSVTPIYGVKRLNIFSKTYIRKYKRNFQTVINLEPKIKQQLLELQTSQYNSAKNLKEIDTFLIKFKNSSYAVPHLIAEADRKRINLLNKEYELDYKIASSINSQKEFVSKYTQYGFDPKGYVSNISSDLKVTEKKLALVNKRKRVNEIEQKNEQFIVRVKNYRTNLSEGDSSNCGLIVEVKTKIVQVQTIAGLHYIKKDQVYPASDANCQFYNGVYQAPSGLPL